MRACVLQSRVSTSFDFVLTDRVLIDITSLIEWIRSGVSNNALHSVAHS